MSLLCSKESQQGQTIVEILIAVAVGALVLTAITATTTITVSNAEFAQRKTEAVKYLEEGVENVRIARDNQDSWSDFLNLPWDDETIGSYTRVTTVTDTGPNEVTVTVVVRWTDAKGTHEVTSTTILTNWAQ